MPSLLERIQTNTIQALKDQKPEIVASLRLLSAALKNEQIALGRELTEQEEASLVQRLVKQRQEAADQYNKANRVEQAAHEEREIVLYEAYLPTQLSDHELREIIDQAIKETHANSINDFGNVMKLVMIQAKGRADGQRITQLVRESITHGT